METRRTDCSCDPMSRRGFLGLSLGGALGLGLSGLGGWTRPAWAQEATRAGLPGFGVAEHCVILWMAGAPSQLETWDPKPGTPQGGPTQAIKTSAKGVQIAHTLPRLAEHMHRVALVRSMSTKEGNHQRGRYFLHTGYVPSGTVAHPDIGALICQQKADPDSELPPYISVGGATPGAGLLGVRYAPFAINDPRQPVENMAYAEGISKKRFRRRRKLLEQLDAGFMKKRSGPETEGHHAIVQKADRLMHSPRAKAFELDQEPAALRKAYGDNKFGQGCLMARRLIEQGARVVEVQLGGWDTHRDNFTKTTELGGQLDAGFATLLADLAERDLLQKTLVVCMGEFGRTPRINPNEGRDHFPRAWSLALAGGPIRGGTVLGGTSPDGMQVSGPSVNAPQIMATVAHAMGLDREVTNYANDRPIPLIDEDAQPLKQLFQA